MTLKSLCAAAMTLLLLTGCKSGYNLKFNPKAGTKYKVEMVTNSTTGQEMMGQKTEMNSISEMTMLYEIAKADGADKEIKITFERMKTAQKAGGQEMVMDTQNPDTSNPGSRMLGAMMGSEFLLTINAKGEVTSVKGMDAMMNKVMAANASADTAMRVQLTAGMKSFMSDDILKDMMEQSFKFFPDDKVGQGESWKKDMVISKPMPMNITSNFTLKNVASNIAKLDVASVITPGKGGMEMMGMTIETEMNGTQSGTMDVDVETGMALNTDIKQNIAGKMKVMGQEIPMNISSVITMKATKL